MVVTTGAVWDVQSCSQKCHHQINTQFLYSRMTFLSPNQQRPSKSVYYDDMHLAKIATVLQYSPCCYICAQCVCSNPQHRECKKLKVVFVNRCCPVCIRTGLDQHMENKPVKHKLKVLPAPAYLLSYESIVISLRFNGHFPGEPGLAGVYWSKGWWRWWWQLEL